MNLKQFRPLAAGLLSLAAGAAAAATEAPTVLDPVQSIATREPEAVSRVPASVSIVSGEDLRARGANDLRTALSLVAGVEGTPGGDGGPAGSVPAMWGLREADAYLLVVDGVPWGGAFNPATPSIDLTGVERIEVLRGGAPVMYGATSFSGVIHVIHYAAGTSPASIGAGGGSYGSFNAWGTANLPDVGNYKQALVANIEKRSYKTDREEYKRYHVLYRGADNLSLGKFHLDADVSIVPQKPGSLLIGDDTGLRDDLSPDANHNPSDAKINQRRVHLAAGLESATGLGDWSNTLAVTRTTDDIVRGFLRKTAPADMFLDPAGPGDGNDADGYTQNRQITDIYFDTHLQMDAADTLSTTLGIDYLYGDGKQNANNYAYFVGLDGSGAPATAGQAADEAVVSEDRRNFFGIYAQADWQMLPTVDVLAGVRLNHTRESATGTEFDSTGTPTGCCAASQLNQTRVSGAVGASWHAYRQGNNALTFYVDYRNTYKPLAVDFGPEAEVSTLQPETASSYEAGVKGRMLDGRLSYDASVFWFDFRNGLTFDTTTAPPARVNGGKQRFKGAELETRYAVAGSLQLLASGSYHDSRFVAFTQDDGSDLAGKRLETAPYVLGALGLVYAPPRGFNASVISNYTGPRALNNANTLGAGGYTTLDAGLGYRFGEVALRINGYNLTDRRDPVTASELSEVATGHDGVNTIGYHRLPARSVMASVSLDL